MDSAGTITIFSPDMHPYSGYGRESIALVRGAVQSGWKVSVIGDDVAPFAEQLPADIREALAQPMHASLGGIKLGYPFFEKCGTLFNAGPIVSRTMFESTILPKGWVENLNKAAAVCVPTEWNREIFQKNGVFRPIYVVPDGISEKFVFVKRTHYPKVFTFLCFADRGERKNWRMAIKAFVAAFGKDERYKLIVKTRENGLPQYDRFTNPNIEILRADYDDGQMMDLYSRVHCMIFPSAGEGFGLPPREFAATGGPSICTNWSGLADNISKWGYPLGYSGLVRAFEDEVMFEGQDVGKWAEPDEKHLVQQLRHVADPARFELWARGRKSGTLRMEAQGERVAQAVRQLYSWERFGKSILKIWEGVLEEFARKNAPPVGDRRKRRNARRKEKVHASGTN